jgi:adenosylhomocysteine nucleosidase
LLKVLIIEDSDSKANAIIAEIEQFFRSSKKIDRCVTFSDVAKKIFENAYDFIVFDLMLPRRSGETEVDFSEELLSYLSTSERNANAVIVGLSKFSNVVYARVSEFASKMVFLLHFDEAGSWRQSLNLCMQRVAQNNLHDFVILCALEAEREAFRNIKDVECGELSNFRGMDCRALTIHGYRGLCLVQPRMGLVDATAVAAFALSECRPRILAMAGICAGFSKEAKIGSLIVSDPCWEHQAGKWKGSEFQLSHYQEPLNNEVRTCIAQIIKRDPTLSNIRYGFRELKMAVDDAALVAPSVSGSAVIASGDMANSIAEQHRKIAALDMEVYGVYRAAALYPSPVKFFAAKTVVDFADERKGDDIHIDGAMLSARFVCAAIHELLMSES